MESIDTTASVKRITQEFIVLWRLTNATGFRALREEFVRSATTDTRVHVKQDLWELVVKSTLTHASPIPAGTEPPAIITPIDMFVTAEMGGLINSMFANH